MKLLKKTGLSFSSGIKLTAADLTKLNDTINDLVEAVNNIILAKYDVNAETKNYERKYTLSAAIRAISNVRRQLGMVIRFLSTSGMYVEYSFCGNSLDDSSFLDTQNWETGVEQVDGGEF